LEETKMPSYLIIAQILVALALIVVVMLQVKGGGLGGIFGQPDSVYRTRRGVERTLFQMTVALAILFVVLSVLVVNLKV
jgi:preprotein translocase subunit SecG